MLMDKVSSAAQSCAKEIVESLFAAPNLTAAPQPQIYDEALIKKARIESVSHSIQRLLSSEVAKVHQEYQKLAKEWRNDMAALNGFTGDVAQFRKAVLECASRVQALAPNKEI